MITATIKNEHYACAVHDGTHQIITDEPADLGGSDKGFAPKSLLLAALASCVAITLRMYADRKAWPITQIEVKVNLLQENAITVFAEEITCVGNLSAMQKDRLAEIAQKCPISKILAAGSQIKSKVL